MDTVHNWNKGMCLGKVGMYIVVVGIHKGLDNNVGKVHKFGVEYLLYMVFHGMGNHGNTDKHSLVSFK
ncbi:hypothetical protein ABN254_21565 [Providencia rettgeri]